MNAMTCEEVQDQLDLLAAGECDPPTKDALEQHLGACPACSASYAQSQRLLGLLDIHWNDRGVERLRQRIEQQARPAPQQPGQQPGSQTQFGNQSQTQFGNRGRIRPFIHRSIAVAALFLIAVGLMLWAPIWDPDRKGSEPALALLVHARKEIQAPEPEKHQDLAKGQASEKVAIVALASRGGAMFRSELDQAQRAGKLPLPPAISLELVLVNNGNRPLEVRLGEEKPTLSLEVAGDGVVRMSAPKAQEKEEPEFLRTQALQLDAGKKHTFHIDRLIAGSRGNLEYIYLTEPGENTLTASLRLTADGQVVTVTGAPVRIKVRK
jgi:anti-sigma factor RsiW